jgi:hypothetical protein
VQRHGIQGRDVEDQVMTAEEIAKLVARGRQASLRISHDDRPFMTIPADPARDVDVILHDLADALEACAKDVERLDWIIEKRPDLGGWLWVGDLDRTAIDAAFKAPEQFDWMSKRWLNKLRAARKGARDE